MTNRDLLAPKEMTSKELKELVDEYVANGGKITQVAPGTALNLRGSLFSGPEEERPKVRVYKKRKAAGKKRK